MPIINALDGSAPVTDADLTVVNARILDGIGDEPADGSVRIEGSSTSDRTSGPVIG